MSRTLYVNNSQDTNKIVSSTGNKVQLNLSVPISLDNGKNWYMRVLQGSVVYCDPNVTSTNNLFRFKYNGDWHPCRIPVGLYDIKGLNAITSWVTYSEVGNSKLFRFVADESTSQIYVYFYVANTSIDCSNDIVDGDGNVTEPVTNIMGMLGFPGTKTTFVDQHFVVTANIIGGFETIPDKSYKMVKGDYKAQLNSIQSILVRCNVTQSCSYLNNQPDNIICSIIPNCLPWGTIEYKPYFPPKCLITVRNIYQLEFELLDEKGIPVDFTSENTDPTKELWSLEVEIFSE